MYLSDSIYSEHTSQPGQLIGTEEVTPPASEPLSVAEAKLHLKVDHDEEDALIASYVKQARQRIENAYGVAMLAQTLRAQFAGRFTYAHLPRTPVTSLVSVSLQNGSTTTEIDPATLLLTLGKRPAISRLSGSRLCDGGILTAEFECGHASAAAVPEILKQAIRLTIWDAYENRGTFVTGTVIARLPGTVKELMAEAGYGRVSI